MIDLIVFFRIILIKRVRGRGIALEREISAPVLFQAATAILIDLSQIESHSLVMKNKVEIVTEVLECPERNVGEVLEEVAVGIGSRVEEDAWYLILDRLKEWLYFYQRIILDHLEYIMIRFKEFWTKQTHPIFIDYLAFMRSITVLIDEIRVNS